MINSIARYKKELNKKLLCSSKDKKKLLGQFDVMLNGFLEETVCPSSEQLEDAFGPPENMAETLLTSVSTEDLAHYQKHHRVTRVLIKALVVIALAASIILTVKLYLDSQTPVIIDEVIVIDGTQPVIETEELK